MRIRTIKPEWLEDERLITAGSDARVLSIAAPLAEDAGCPVLEYVALEWLALIALIASGDAAPKGPTIAYFVARFGRLETDRAEAAAPQIPARMGPTANRIEPWGDSHKPGHRPS